MAIWLRQSTATTVEFGPFVEATDGYSYKATTITLASGSITYRWENGNVTGIALAAPMPFPGWVAVPLAVSDTAQAGKFMLRCGNATSNLPVWREYMIVPANVYDSMILGSANLAVNAVSIAGQTPTNITFNAAVLSIAAGVGVNVSSVNAGVGVNVTSINGAAVSSATVAAGSVLDYVMFNPGVQTITVKDVLKVIVAGAAGKLDGATGAAVRLYDPSGTVRVSAAVVSGNRTGVTWVTG